jgi:DNA polymerase III subunit delta'
MLFEWLQPAFQQLLQRRAQFPHALLLYGSEGIGKHELALQLGKSLLCDNPQPDGMACGLCTHCRLIAAGTHPDWFMVGLEMNDSGKLSSEIKIGQIRSLCQSLIQTRHSGRYKIAIINPADRMNRNAANSLLKTLEEPVPETLLLLVSSQASRLPATIRSRCQQLRVKAPDQTAVKEWLHNHYSGTDTEALYAASGGSPIAATEIVAQELLPVRSGVLGDMRAILIDAADPLAVAEKWKDSDLRWIFSWLIGWLEDLILIKRGGQQAVLNADLTKPLAVLSDRIDLAKLFNLHERVLQAKQLLDSTVNHRLLYESLLLDWSDLRQH